VDYIVGDVSIVGYIGRHSKHAARNGSNQSAAAAAR
jgi:hypothetical protein